MIEVEIFPHRYLKASTTEKFLNKLYDLKTVERVVIHGQPLPKVVYYGPARGLPVNHSERKIIEVKGVPVELTVMAGRFIVTLSDDSELEKIEEICKEMFPFGYDIKVGKFLKEKPTVTDYLKYGEKGVQLINEIDRRLIGMIDPRSRLKDSLAVVEKESDDQECQ
ncbi:methyl-coenzyme M reductase operon protein D [Methanocaldococcus infernus]|uniref:Methyl-coenzyme M reductase operon protein D n=1 Tax=Methanocaldococcus infernus (strain DSM 11812 / JCM 15783 / ME) TaxID=573063 RepID=D5VQV1_METIM|nr:methyl-coenzyme M reductase operon protein D [Methanocaldococcus infernus]ADG12954.1 methyl-coenzyme M reductase operon protein D [Methanocaldococcus infernus ME]